MPVLLIIIPRNSCLAAPKMHLAKLTDKPAASNRLSAFSIEVRCSSQVTLAIRMSSSQLATSSSGSLRTFRTMRVNANGRTVIPHPALLNSYSYPSGSRKAVLYLSFSAILTWWEPDAKSIWVNSFFPFSPSKIVCILPSPLLSATSCSLSALQSMHRRRVPSFFFTQRHWAAHGEFDGLIMPRSKSFLVSSRIMWRSSGENLRCFSATGVHVSFFSLWIASAHPQRTRAPVSGRTGRGRR